MKKVADVSCIQSIHAQRPRHAHMHGTHAHTHAHTTKNWKRNDERMERRSCSSMKVFDVSIVEQRSGREGMSMMDWRWSYPYQHRHCLLLHLYHTSPTTKLLVLFPSSQLINIHTQTDLNVTRRKEFNSNEATQLKTYAHVTDKRDQI